MEFSFGCCICSYSDFHGGFRRLCYLPSLLKRIRCDHQQSKNHMADNPIPHYPLAPELWGKAWLGFLAIGCLLYFIQWMLHRPYSALVTQHLKNSVVWYQLYFFQSWCQFAGLLLLFYEEKKPLQLYYASRRNVKPLLWMGCKWTKVAVYTVNWLYVSVNIKIYCPKGYVLT